MSIVDSIANACLSLGHQEVIVPFIICGIILRRREPYAQACCFFCFAMIFNAFLKHVFKVPLFPHLGEGYAFPSGHMHAAAILYGYLLYKTKGRQLRLFLASLILLEGFALIHCRYHDLIDVSGALAFAAAEITIYHVLEKNFRKEYIAIFVLAISGLIMIMSNILFGVIEKHVWLAFYGMAGMLLSMHFFENIRFRVISQKIAALLLSAAMMYCIHMLCTFSGITGAERFYVSQIPFLFFPMALFSAISTTRIFSKTVSVECNNC